MKSITASCLFVVGTLTLSQILPTNADPIPIGAVILSRHGSRFQLYKNPDTLQESNSNPELTVDGVQQHLSQGKFLRDRWINVVSGAGLKIEGLSADYKQEQVFVRSSDTDRTITSAYSLLKGLYPNMNTSLPGIPIHSVSANEDTVLRSWLECPKLDKSVQTFYNSSEFKKVESDNKDFLSSLEKAVGRKVLLKDIWNVFDYLNVQQTQNASFVGISSEDLKKLSELVRFVETSKFSKGYDLYSFTSSLINEINYIATSYNSALTTTRKLTYFSGHITTFISFIVSNEFSPSFSSLPDYASLLVFEVSRDSLSNEKSVSVFYKDGVNGVPVTLSLPGKKSLVSVTEFSQYLSGKISGSSSWCEMCENRETRGCDAANALKLMKSGQLQYVNTMFGKGEMIGTGVGGFLGGIVLSVLVLFGAKIVKLRRKKHDALKNVLEDDVEAMKESQKI
ncbi:hypothetical protein HK098_006160 [Nowakowskiella sp. JEL0407]|nr:hypothetical protein HK098_006160 [Nowakowskiella sp. JEL0407]